MVSSFVRASIHRLALIASDSIGRYALGNLTLQNSCS